jgi:hypothetical protein
VTNPSSDDDTHPWEHPGVVRRDCEPHRSGVLEMLAWASLAGGAVPFALMIMMVMFSGSAFVQFLLRAVSAAVVTVILPLAIVTRILAWRDLKKMRAGLMDLAGAEPARRARFVSLLGLVLGLLASVAALGTFGLHFSFNAVAPGFVLLFLFVGAQT